MQKLIIILTLFLVGWLIPANGQTAFDNEMQSALKQFQTTGSTELILKSAAQFDQISKENPENWLPLYYSILAKSIAAFSLDTENAIKIANTLEKDYDKLMLLNPDESEALTLRAFFRTVKLAKDPQNYGMVLPSAIIADYNHAIQLKPENPRPLYLLAQFNMKSAPYYGNDPKVYCPMIHSAMELFQKEIKNTLFPNWGEDKAAEIIKTECDK